MKTPRRALLKNVDCLRLYVPDLRSGMEYYCDGLGMKVVWKTESAIGLGMGDHRTEVVLQNHDQWSEIDIQVDSVVEAVKTIAAAGGEIVCGPFDLRIGKGAVVKDPWGNQYVILDATQGTLITDGEGNIVGQKKLRSLR
jgi:lactoylglutathione lyase